MDFALTEDQRAIQDAAYEAQKAIDHGSQVLVGVNRFATDEPVAIDLLRVDPAVEREQIERLRQMRASRSAGEWETAMAAVVEAARSGANLVAPIVAAGEARATVGEIANALRAEFGEFREALLD